MKLNQALIYVASTGEVGYFNVLWRYLKKETQRERERESMYLYSTVMQICISRHTGGNFHENATNCNWINELTENNVMAKIRGEWGEYNEYPKKMFWIPNVSIMWKRADSHSDSNSTAVAVALTLHLKVTTKLEIDNYNATWRIGKYNFSISISHLSWLLSHLSFPIQCLVCNLNILLPSAACLISWLHYQRLHSERFVIFCQKQTQ